MSLLQKFLTTPSKLALTFDRSCTAATHSSASNAVVESMTMASGQALHSTILCLDIETELIGMTIGWHPSTIDEGMPSAALSLPSLKLESIPTLSKNYKYHRQHQKRRLADMNNNNNNSGSSPLNVVQLLDNVVQKYNVCGVLVAWPVQRDTGKVGAACGRVLHSLENLLSSIQEQDEQQHGSGSGDQSLLLRRSDGTTNARSRDSYIPFCLWNPYRTNSVQIETTDEWGRCSAYATNPDDPYYKAANARATSGYKVYLDDVDRDEPADDGYQLFGDDNTETDYYHPLKNYYASKERYHYQQELASSRRQRQSQIVWDDFCRFHWPSYCDYRQVGGTAQQKSLAKKRASLIPGYSRKWKNAFHQDGDDDNSSGSASSSSGSSRPVTPGAGDTEARAATTAFVEDQKKTNQTLVDRTPRRSHGSLNKPSPCRIDANNQHWNDSTVGLAALL